MRKYIYSLIAIAALLLSAGCSKEKEAPVVDKAIAGQWHLTSWSSETPAEFDVYIELLTSGNFNMYQKVETPVYVRYTGTYSADKGIFSGKYSDGLALSHEYGYELSGDGNTLTMTAGNDVNVYTRTEIPKDVMEAADTFTKSDGGSFRFL